MFCPLFSSTCVLTLSFNLLIYNLSTGLSHVFVNIKVEHNCRIVSFQSDKQSLNTSAEIVTKKRTDVRENLDIPVISCIRFRSSNSS